MSNFSPFQFDPSKMDPKLLMEMSQVIRELSPNQLSRMQTLMHNMMAGFDVRKEMEEFEKDLPPGFREKLSSIMARQTPVESQVVNSVEEADDPSPEMNMKKARLTILQAVAEGRMPPEEAEKLLFPQDLAG